MSPIIYDNDAAQRTDDADYYRGFGGKDYDHRNHKYSLRYQTVQVLPELIGQPWNNAALYKVHSLRPSHIDIISPSNPGMTLEAKYWNVFVYLEDDERTIKEIKQAVELGDLPAIGIK